MKNDLEEIHSIELAALKELSKFLQKNDINFFLRGGSVMGAIKYSGFVPWDDDIDIAIPRSQYNKLINLISKEQWSDNYYIAHYRYNNNLNCYFPRVIIKDSGNKFPKNTQIGTAIIDILPIDGVPNNWFLREIYYIKILFFRALAGTHTPNYKNDKLHSTKVKSIIKILKFLKIGKNYSQVELYEKLDSIYSENDYKKSKMIGTLTGSLFKKEIFPKEVWGTGISKKFVDTDFLVPEQYDTYLKKMYGKEYLTTEPSRKKQENKKHISS